MEQREACSVARRCSVCHTPAVGGTIEAVGLNGQTRIKKVPHAQICPGHCTKPFAECQYLAGHPEEKERRRQERTGQSEKRKQDKESTRQKAKAEKKQAREAEIAKKAEQVIKKRSARAPVVEPFRVFLERRGYTVENSPMALQSVIKHVHDFRQTTQAPKPYEPGVSFDPKLADVARDIINRMGQEEGTTLNGWSQEKGKETEEQTYSSTDLWAEDDTPLIILRQRLEQKKAKRAAIDNDIKVLGAKIAYREQQELTRRPKKLRKASSFEL